MENECDEKDCPFCELINFREENKMSDTHTRDLSQMPLDQVKDLFVALDNDGWPSDFSERNVVVEYNKKSGNVYFTNDNSDCCMINTNSKQLESHYSTPCQGYEGFFDDLVHYFDRMNEDDQEYVRNIAANIDREDDLPPLENDDLE